MTVEQLEAFSNTKPELRYITEEIIKYLGANPGGGSPGSSYLVLATAISQTGTNAPDDTDQRASKTLTGDISFTYSDVGNYTIENSNDEFIEGKTIILYPSVIDEFGTFATIKRENVICSC